MIDFNKIVKKLLQRQGNIVLLQDIEEIIDPTNARREGKSEVYKTLSRLVHTGILYRIRNGVFLIGHDPLLERISQFIDTRYWELVMVFIRAEVGASRAVIAGPKSLELLLQDFSPPKILHIYVAELDSPKKILHIGDDYRIEFRTIQSGKTTGKSLFPALRKTSLPLNTPGLHTVKLRILSEEAALLDALLTHSGKKIDRYMIDRFLERHAASLSREILGKLVELRYITSINRLREIAKLREDIVLYELCLSIIRDEGAGCFVSGGLD